MRQILESPQCAPTEIVHPKILNVIGRVLCYVAACYTLKEDGIREYADDMLQLSKVVSQVYAVLLDKFALSFRPSVDDSTKFVADVVNTARSIGGLPVCPEYVVKSLTLAVKALHTNCLQQANAKKVSLFLSIGNWLDHKPYRFFYSADILFDNIKVIRTNDEFAAST